MINLIFSPVCREQADVRQGRQRKAEEGSGRQREARKAEEARGGQKKAAGAGEEGKLGEAGCL